MCLQGFTSRAVQLNLGDLTLKRSGGASAAGVPAKGLATADLASNPLVSAPAALSPAPAISDATNADIVQSFGDAEDAGAESGAAAVPMLVGDEAGTGRPAERQGKATVGMAKKYGPGFIWGQLNGWYKQTVFDPTASLSAERRGTISMPDIESCYGSARNRFSMKVSADCTCCPALWSAADTLQALAMRARTAAIGDTAEGPSAPGSHSEGFCHLHLQDRDQLIDHLEKRPETMWKIGTIWTFKNEAKVYGSPMFDAVWAGMQPERCLSDPMPELISKLRSAPLPRSAAAPGH